MTSDVRDFRQYRETGDLVFDSEVWTSRLFSAWKSCDSCHELLMSRVKNTLNQPLSPNILVTSIYSFKRCFREIYYAMFISILRHNMWGSSVSVSTSSTESLEEKNVDKRTSSEMHIPSNLSEGCWQECKSHARLKSSHDSCCTDYGFTREKRTCVSLVLKPWEKNILLPWLCRYWFVVVFLRRKIGQEKKKERESRDNLLEVLQEKRRFIDFRWQ